MIHTAERNGFSVQLSRKQKKAGKRKQADDKANSPIFRVTADEAAPASPAMEVKRKRIPMADWERPLGMYWS